MDRNQMTAYFERIGLVYSDYEGRPCDRALLDELHRAHQFTIPFENLDMVAGIPVSLEPEKLFEKIILRRRGGNCFEINGLSGEFLRALGYGVRDCFSRYFRDAQGEIPFRRHRMLLVETLDGTYFWDIGIGQRSPLSTLRLCEGVVQEQRGERYRFTKEPFFGWMLWEEYKGEWLRILSFTEEPQHWVDFVTTCVWCELSPDSPFHQVNIVALKTPNGRKTIDGDTFRCFEGEQVQERGGLSGDALTKVLWEEFGLVV